MRLSRLHASVGRVRWAARSSLDDGLLSLDRDGLAASLAGEECEVAALELVHPGEPCRIVNVADVFLPQLKLDPAGADFPGVLGPPRPAGTGTTLVLDGVAVTVTRGVPDRYSKVVESGGRAAALSPYGALAHVVVCTRPRAGTAVAAYERALRVAGLRAAVEVARAARAAPPAVEERIDIDPERAAGLPRVGYAFMIASLQRPPGPQEPILYGTSLGAQKPLLLHPAEVLDGALVCPRWSLAMETYAIQDHAIVRALCRRHGQDLCCAGVLATVAQVDPTERLVSVEMTAHLARWALRADGMVFSKAGGGIPESDMILAVEACERAGIRTSGVLWSHLGTGPDDSLVLPSPAARLTSVGIQDQRLRLPGVERVVGALDRSPPPAGEGEGGGGHGPESRGPLAIQYRDLAGAISQIGHGRVAMVTETRPGPGPAGEAGGGRT